MHTSISSGHVIANTALDRFTLLLELLLLAGQIGQLGLHVGLHVIEALVLVLTAAVAIRDCSVLFAHKTSAHLLALVFR